MEENRLLYSQQGNRCVSHLRKIKKSYWENLDKTDISVGKLFNLTYLVSQ